MSGHLEASGHNYQSESFAKKKKRLRYITKLALIYTFTAQVGP